MIAVTAAKLSWKLGPTSDSGQKVSTNSAPAATIRKVIALRPIISATSTSKAATQARIVGTCAPVNSV